MNSRKHPVHVVQRNRIAVAVWHTSREESGTADFAITTWRRSPQDSDWIRTDSFRSDELLHVAQALIEAHTWILAAQRSIQVSEASHAN